MFELNQSVVYLCTLTPQLNLRDQILKKVSVPIEIGPIVMVKNDKVEDDILCQKSFDFIITSNVNVHVNVGELEKKEAKIKACSLLKMNLARNSVRMKSIRIVYDIIFLILYT